MMRPVSVRSVCSAGISAGDRDLLVQLPDLERDIHAHGRVDVDRDPVTLVLAEALELRLDAVRAAQQAAEGVVAAFVRHGGAADARVHVRDCHGHPRHGGTARIGDVADQGAANGLGVRCWWPGDRKESGEGREDGQSAEFGPRELRVGHACLLKATGGVGARSGWVSRAGPR